MQRDLFSDALWLTYFSKEKLLTLYQEKTSLNNAVGKDGTTQFMFKNNISQEIKIIINKTLNLTYEFTRYREKLIPKGAGKAPRQISIPTIRDRLTLRVVNDILVEAFPDAKSVRPHTYIREIKEKLRVSERDLSFLRMDVKDFYPSIDHKILIKKIKKQTQEEHLIDVIKKAISTPTGAQKTFMRGIPQGLSISNILSSIYMNDLDEDLSAKFTYFRYVDDILILCPSSDAQAAHQYVADSLKKLRLKCHKLGEKGKSQICSTGEGIEYLGFHLRQGVVSVRQSSFTRMMENILSVFSSFKHARENQKNINRLIWKLNLKITGCIYEGKRYGWMFFFSQIDDTKQLKRLDYLIQSETKKRNLNEITPHIKKFAKTYYKIRKNKIESYIPNFDELGTEDFIGILADLDGKDRAEIAATMSEEDIRARFFRMIRRETRSLEADLIEATS